MGICNQTAEPTSDTQEMDINIASKLSNRKDLNKKLYHYLQR